MLCSIIIPLYNKVNFVTDALQSVLNQTYPNFEVIVVDDGSTDGSSHCVLALNDARIKLIQQPNSGVSRARNVGIDHAKGDLVCFLDADDWYLPIYLATIVALAQQHAHIQFFTTQHKLVNTTRGDSQQWPLAAIAKTEIIDDLFSCWQGSLFHISSFAVRRPFLLTFQPCFPVGEQMGEDQDLFFRLAEQSSFAHHHSPLTGYRIGLNDSLCGTYRGSCLFPAYQRLEQRALNRQLSGKLRQSALRMVADNRITLVRNHLIAGKRWQAIQQLALAWRGMVSRRWWVSLLLLFANSRSIERWECWRRNKPA
jgi:glycosyltransferase involved in cell wall biosynthesis